MIEKGKLIFKFWFKNGTYIEKEMVLDENTSQEDIENFQEKIPSLMQGLEEGFKKNLNGSFSINNMVVRYSELIAFDIIPIVEEQANDDL